MRGDPARVAGELPGVRGTQGLAATRTRRHSGGPLYSRTVDEEAWPAGCAARQIHQDDRWRQLEAVPAGPRAATVQGRTAATLEWVDWFNHRRLLEPIGNVPPAEAEAAYYAKLAGSAVVA
ncbi:hypothetical protein BN2475_1030003 [Paraburkholderia ribeironis]|uniref:Integrase catalytic domain-containing protein n=1 Tax=Paraburkholderia ribeironis TaxID=1247936 RepID=A0A1N7SM71_9BURK|nr:hypothetical protein BN2475_1030003 [Paraburkholderia ribeironis]